MNNAGAMNSRLIVILNDNDMSIAPSGRRDSAYLSRLYSGKDLPHAARGGEADHKVYRKSSPTARTVSKNTPAAL